MRGDRDMMRTVGAGILLGLAGLLVQIDDVAIVDDAEVQPHVRLCDV